MALISGLGTALSGMKVAQTQLDIIGRNIANVDTVGYTRKQAQQKSVVLAGSSMGVTIGDVTRSVNQGLLKSFLSSNSLTGQLNAQNEYLSKTEILLGTPEGDNSISANVANLQAAFNSFASDVTSASGRYNLLNQAQTVTSRLNSISQEIQKLRGDADLNITSSVAEINDLLDEIHELNENIVKYKVLKYDGVADLEDKRDTALRNLSEKIDISYFTRDTGEIVIQTTGGITLLDRDPHKLTHSAVTQTSATSTYAGGAIGGIMVDGVDITNQLRQGELKGLVEIRDVTLPSLQSQLDELAGVLKDSINQIHNQGTAYPQTPSEMTGTRDIINPDNQNIRISNGDVRFTIFDQDGKQVSTTTLLGDLHFPDAGASITDMTTTINNWLRDPNGANLPQAECKIDQDGHLYIETGDSSYTISIMDEASSTPGGEQKDVTIEYDVNGDGNYDRTFSGFSNFFGMNDFFVSNRNENIYDSKVISKNVNLGLRDIVTIGFSSSNSDTPLGSINIYPNDSVQDIVNKINNDPNLNQQLRASLVPNGSGYVLRIEDTTGSQLEIYENVAPGGTSSGVLEKLGMAPSNAGMAATIGVREELQAQPNLICGGSPEFNAASGEYQLNPAMNNIANAMGKVFDQTLNFNQSGTISETQTTLANYAATFVGNIASQTSNAESTLAYQQQLTNSISLKEAQVSGVDMDEELAQMIVFQQTYAACAQAFTASKEILDLLLNMVN